LGLELPSSKDWDDAEAKKFQRLVDKYYHHLQEKIPEEIFLWIVNSSPHCFPMERPINPIMHERIAVHTHCMEILLLNIHVESCACCGCVWPVQEDCLLGSANKAKDPITGNVTVFQRHHFQEIFHDVYLCTCSGFCWGSQFFCKSWHNHKKIFVDAHDGLQPEEALQAVPHQVKLVHVFALIVMEM
jgi:hypothetical protein